MEDEDGYVTFWGALVLAVAPAVVEHIIAPFVTSFEIKRAPAPRRPAKRKPRKRDRSFAAYVREGGA